MRTSFDGAYVTRAAVGAAVGAAFAAAFAATFAGVVAAACVATFPAALPAQATVRIRKSLLDSTARDSTVRVMINVSGDDIARMIGDLLSSRAMEERIAMAMRGERGDSRNARELEAQLQSIVRRNAGLVSAIRLQCASEDEQPAGYMGINFEGITISRRSDGPTMYALGERATIVSVEPGSPAQRAGLEAADEIVSIAGNDTRRPFALGALLKPGAKLALRVSRDGRRRDVTVTVGKRPDEYGSPCTSVDDVMSGFKYSPQTTFRRRTEPPMAGTMPRSPNPDAAIATPQGFGYAFVTPYATGSGNLIGGASFVVLTADWRETLGVERGLLVSTVAPGSPAQTAGLKASDVVLAVGDTPVGSPGALWQAVNTAGKDGVTLKVQRAKKEITIVLKPADKREK